MEITGVTYSTSHYEHYNQNGDRNYFEEVIDAMILSEIAGMNETFRTAISNLPRDRKRMTILSLLEKDIKLFNKIKALVDKDINKMEHIKDVVLMLREYVKIAEVEKKKFGEVMTPLDLVKEMLNALPQEVWSNPNLKWLDPANGTGPYPTMVIYKLMKGLKPIIEDDEARYKHIVENMIYVCELQPKNMFLYMCAVDPFDSYKLNVYTGSFLEEGFDYHMKNVWGVDKFDIVIGNPPYNTGTSGGNGNRDLWDKFVVKSISSIKEMGYLNFVHPPKWRKPESTLFDLFKSLNLIYLEIHSNEDGEKVFKANTRYDWYVLQKNSYSGNTKVKDEKANLINLNIYDWFFLPNYNFDNFNNVMTSDKNDRLSILYSSSIYEPRKNYMSKIENDIFKYPCVYGMYQDGTSSFYYSSENRGFFGKSKVILGLGRYLYPLVDNDGIYGMTQNSFAIEVFSEKESSQIKNAINSDKFKDMLKSTKWSNFQVDYKMFKFFRKDFWKEFI